MSTTLIQPPRGLFEKIMARIHREERLLILRHIIIFSTTLLASVIAFVPVFKMVSSDFAQSGFLRFLSLMFSDFSSITAYWQSFVLILLETIPALSLALLLAVVLVFLQSLKSLTKDVKIIYGYR